MQACLAPRQLSSRFHYTSKGKTAKRFVSAAYLSICAIDASALQRGAHPAPKSRASAPHSGFVTQLRALKSEVKNENPHNINSTRGLTSEGSNSCCNKRRVIPLLLLWRILRLQENLAEGALLAISGLCCLFVRRSPYLFPVNRITNKLFGSNFV